jgi:hypothetical protein
VIPEQLFERSHDRGDASRSVHCDETDIGHDREGGCR